MQGAMPAPCFAATHANLVHLPCFQQAQVKCLPVLCQCHVMHGLQEWEKRQAQWNNASLSKLNSRRT